jgi:hypothetical protein
VRLASAFAPFLLLPLVFIWKLISVPASIYREQRKEEDQERVGQIWYLAQMYVEQVQPENAYYIQHGLALPPQDWMNQKLEELDFKWRYRFVQGTQYVTEDLH